MEIENKIISNKIAYWKFKENATVETFMSAFEDFCSMVQKPEIKALMINVEMKDAWSKKIQDIWIKTGEIADQSGIEKWAVVSNELSKQITIKYLVKGAGVKRGYQHMVTSTEKDALDWLSK